MKNNIGEVIGVLQLVNAIKPKTRAVVPFSNEVQAVIESLASQAAVAIDNQLLLEGQRELLDSFIKLIASAIDAKSPYTGGHCARVPLLTEMLADAACESEAPPFKDFDLDEEQKHELMTAAWLHDCGKVTTPEYVVDKATKLETIYDRLHTVQARAEVLKRDAEIAYLKALAEPGAQADRLRHELETTLAEIDDDMAFIDKVNVGGEYLGDKAIVRIKRIASRGWRDGNGADQPFLTENEVYNLSIRRGTLTPEEREAINNHIVMTIEMLEKLPFPKNLRNVPEYAGGHHERMDGNGYPRGLKRHEMSIPARIMAIADVFEALTARDRPYKSAMKLSVAMDILGKMKLEHHIDPDLFDLFVESKAYLRYAEKFLLRDQIDEVDVSKYVGPMANAFPDTLPSLEVGKSA
jgi:HD-GYP domain-containing protein (c-di-GMP phosphodiesterase class II)